MPRFPVSLVIPVRDEERTVPMLLESIARQTSPPDEIVLVDGGSRDRTVDMIEQLSRSGTVPIALVRTEGATPGKGRNLGIEAARNEWIALTDAGIKLEDDWLENLAAAADEADMVLGDYTPVTDTFFTRCAAVAYVPPRKSGDIRARFIASSIVKRHVWEAVGGFPDLRAAEDLFFIENVEKAGFRIARTPNAVVHWQLRPDAVSTFRKFALYSKHNVLAGRQWDWHYPLLRQYIFVLPFLLLAVLHSVWWLALPAGWLLLRTLKRMRGYSAEFGKAFLFNPLAWASVASLLLLIDAATFVGWVQAVSVRTGEPKASSAA